MIETIGQPTARHEAALVAHQGLVYLMGGRRINPVEVFDPVTRTWAAKGESPMELHHFQSVSLGDSIYMVGAMNGRYPTESPLEKVVVYHPATDTFEFVHHIPETRRRGGAGAAVYDGKIYIVGGITNGHQDGYVPWFDRYDPTTGDWDMMPDAPHARDHFQAVVVGHYLYALAGRTTSQRTNHTFDLTVPEVDVFDFTTGAWLPSGTVENLPTPRAGNMAAVIDGKIIIGGGESGSLKVAHEDVESLDPVTGKWSRWPSLARGRHGSGFAVIDEVIYTAAGSGGRGGAPELSSTESLKLDSIMVDDSTGETPRDSRER
nr:kelch motif-containing protein [Rubripirellula tenax]